MIYAPGTKNPRAATGVRAFKQPDLYNVARSKKLSCLYLEQLSFQNNVTMTVKLTRLHYKTICGDAIL